MRSVALVAALALLPAVAHAGPTKVECVQAADRGQSLRDQHKLAAARTALLTCASASCPALVQQSCVQWLDQVERSVPTIAFAVKDTTGNDRTDVTVTVDGTPLTEKLDGTSIPIDPGEHVFVFDAPGYQPLSRRWVLIEGEKGRREVVVLTPTVTEAPVVVAAPVPLPPVAIEPAPPVGHWGTQKVLGVVAAGAGVVSLAVGVVTGVMSLSDASTQKSECTTTRCPDPAGGASAHDAAVTTGAVSTATIIAGGVLVAGGAVLFFTGKSRPSDPAAQVGLTPLAGWRFGGVGLGGSF